MDLVCLLTKPVINLGTYYDTYQIFLTNTKGTIKLALYDTFFSTAKPRGKQSCGPQTSLCWEATAAPLQLSGF